MKAIGLETITQDLEKEGYFVKCIVTSSAAGFFPGTIQHRDIKRENILFQFVINYPI